MKVRSPIDRVYTGVKCITKGRVYAVIDPHHLGGNIIDDDGDKLNILYKDCCFLRGGDWEIVHE